MREILSINRFETVSRKIFLLKGQSNRKRSCYRLNVDFNFYCFLVVIYGLHSTLIPNYSPNMTGEDKKKPHIPWTKVISMASDSIWEQPVVLEKFPFVNCRDIWEINVCWHKARILGSLPATEALWLIQKPDWI